jgi:hypothetical protein
MSRELKDYCSYGGEQGDKSYSRPRRKDPPGARTATSSSDGSSISSAVSSTPIMPTQSSNFSSLYDSSGVAQLPDETLGITIDDDFIQQQEAIMRDFRRNKNQMRAASSNSFFEKKTNAGIVPPPIITPPVSQDEVDTDASYNADTYTSFCDFSNDPELIREQRRIFQEIQRQRETTKPKSITQNEVDHLTEQVLETSIRQSSRRLSGRSIHSQTRGLPDSKIIPSDKVIASCQDRVMRLGNGKTLKVKGTTHAYMSIARGTAIIVTCPCCQTVLQVDASTKLLFCTRCQQVSPIELATANTNNCNHGNGLADAQIAGSVQQQEIDVACARKMSNMEGPRGRL